MLRKKTNCCIFSQVYGTFLDTMNGYTCCGRRAWAPGHLLSGAGTMGQVPALGTGVEMGVADDMRQETEEMRFSWFIFPR